MSHELSEDQETLAVLVSARCLITEPKYWTTHTLARRADGNATCYRSPSARQWCAIGSVRATATVMGCSFGIAELAELFLPSSIVSTNDSGLHSEVLDMFDRAIETVRERIAEASRG